VWGDFFDYPVENFERVMHVNLRGSFFLAQAAARHMRDQSSGGSILLMSSVTGHQAVRYLSAYGMTKAALEMLAKNLVLELSPYNIRINAIAPGAILTPRNLADDPDYAVNWGRVIPAGRAGETLDIANAALFLLSPGAAFITGQTLVVDGGWTNISPTPDLEFIVKPK
jgi:3-oxoacyl-[acyl-carrier protein] reductase